MISPGMYKARAVKGSVQFGETERGNLQVAIDLDIKSPQSAESLGTMTTFLYFTDGAQVYSYDRLRALGWQGKGPDDIDKMDTIDANEVDVRVTQPESYKAPDGTMKMGVSKVEIQAGAGKVTLAKTVEAATFKARLRALGGSAAGSTAPVPAGGSGEPPPF
jgi:hypothetical protein